ncbi:hypothetical protein [Pseudomonas sp. B392_1p]|uniref:hypothetical protein n=1 Tax=Pseudomonas sp. B392_1p TaxID=3457507 RepID=UPI003FD343E8
MEEAIRRSVERQFPELTGAYHLPRFAMVVGVPDAPAEHAIADDFRPRYAVDLQVLLPDGTPDPDLPTLHAVPLPVPSGGQERGLFGIPELGTWVVVGFAYGLPSRPFVQQILAHGLSLPRVPDGDLVWQHSEACQQRADADGNWLRQTDGRIRDDALEREVTALANAEHYQHSDIEVDEHATERVGGIKRIEALGALKLLSGGSATLGAVDDLNLATGRDHNQAIGRNQTTTITGNATATIRGDLLEQIEGLRKSIAAGGQHLEAPKTWIGSEGVNVLQVLLDLVDLVQQMNTQLAAHAHPIGQPPSNAAAFTANAATAQQLNGQLAPITA